MPRWYYFAMTTDLISLDTAIVVTGLSKRTLWRRISDGALRKAEDGPGNSGGGRTLLDARDVLPLMRAPLSAAETALLIEADAGRADAQAEMGAVFHRIGEMKTAVYWWQLAAAQGHADAMQWLGRCYAAGEGVEQDENLALMWISKAAAAGHAIAAAQMAGLLRGAAGK